MVDVLNFSKNCGNYHVTDLSARPFINFSFLVSIW